MKLSVIIPTYNEQAHLESCLKSLNNQVGINFETIIVDDSSTDSTLQIAQKYADQVMRQTHQGPGAARNKGAKNASGQILVFVDADMTFAPDFLQKLTQSINSDIKGTFTIEEKVANYQNIWSKLWNFETTGSKTALRLPADTPKIGPVFRAILKSEFERVKGFDLVGYNDDWTLSQKLGYLAQAAPGAVMYHHNPDSVREVFTQARWIGGRQYKLGEFGRLIALLRASLPISVVVGLIKSPSIGTLKYLPFKCIFDAGIFFGIIKYWLGGGHAR